MTPAKRAWLLFALIACAAYFYGLGNFPFVGPDEPRYAEVARSMYMRGDMVTPMLGGHTWFEKPVLPYWIMIAGYKLFGASEWSARAGFALCGLLTVLVLCWMGRRAQTECAEKEGARWLALMTGLAAASSAGLLLFSHGVNFDIPLTLATTLGLACFFVYELGEGKQRGARRLLLAGFYTGTGVALLAKGLIGFIITFGVVALYYALRRAWPGREVALSLLWGLPLAILVVALWYAPVISRHGWAFIDEFFIQHHFARYTSNKYRHPQPFYFYIPIILMMALPWTPHLVEAVWSARRWQWRSDDALSKWRVFAFCWLLVPVLFFSASGSKLPGYILPALPGALMLIGERLSRMMSVGRAGVLATRVAGALLVLLALGCVIYIWREGYAVIACAITVAAFLIAGGLLALLLAGRGQLAPIALACAMLMMVAVGLSCGVEAIARRISMAHALERAGALGYGQSPVFHLHTIERTAEYYAAGRLQYGPDGEPLRFEGATQVERAAREQGGTVLVIVPTEHASQITTYAPLESEIIDDKKEVSLIAVRLRK